MIVRVLTGALFAYAAYMKFVHMNDTVENYGTLAGFATMGLSATIAWTVSIGEALIGLGLIFGVWTRLAAAGAIVILIGAWHYTMFTWMIGAPLITSIILLVLGGGAWALTNCKPKEVAPTAATPTASPTV